MPRLSDQLPRFLLGKYQLTATVTFAAFWSLVFLVLSIPFSHNAWFALGRNEAFIFTVVFYLLSLAIVSCSNMAKYALRGSDNFTVLRFILWAAGEIVLISLIYSFFTVEGIKYGIITPEHSSFGRIFLGALAYSFMSLGVPYVIAALYLMVEEKDNTIRLMSYSDVVSDTPITQSDESRITLFDNSGALKFSVNPDSLYFIESDDNYIQAWYSDSSGQMRKYMLRCRLKTVEESFSGSDLVRCHRKYIINIRKVRVLTSSKDGYTVQLDNDTTPEIPVSKTYEQAVLARFNSRQ
ncbi:MAG: LytTR family transcriptional regulator [Bacteroidales bacterium]|nr:LytTR family transcriptional regulator [Bacteroidales bacterium]